MKPAALVALPLLLVAVLILPGPLNAQTPPPTPQANTPAAELKVNVVVALENGTRGGRIPPGVALMLHALDARREIYTREAESDAAGLGNFTDLPYQEGRQFVATARMGNTTYVSQLVAPEKGQSELKVSLRVYDTTTDISQLRVSQAFVLAEAKTSGQLQIISAYILSNGGDRTVEGGVQSGAGAPATLEFPLPPDAQDVQFESDDGSRYARTEKGFVARPGVPPGDASGRVVVRYSVPYTDALRIDSTLAYPVDKLTVFVATQGITLTSPLLTSLGTEMREDGVSLRVWGATEVAANQPLVYDLGGRPQQSPAVPPQQEPVVSPPEASQGDVVLPRTSTRGGPAPRVWIGAGLVGLGLLVALVAAGWWLYGTRFVPDPRLVQQRRLVRALADLDDDHEAGRIESADYEYRRARLTAVLAGLQIDPGAPSGAF